MNEFIVGTTGKGANFTIIKEMMNYWKEEKMEEHITAAEYSKLKGKDSSWGSRLAKKANRSGYPYPKKAGNYWIATLEEWEKALKNTGLQLRDRQSYRK